MANSPSEKWENGVLVERAIETNRWTVKADGTSASEAEAETDAEEDDDAEAEGKAVGPAQTENKSVKRSWKK